MPDASPFVKEITEATFEKDVLQRSHTVPVIVDFWATWCGPCRVLGPLLEREVAARNGAVEMVKLDTDKNQALAAQFAIRSIPAVKAFRNGQIVEEFQGALPVPQIRAFLDKIAPSQSAADLDKAKTLLSAGDATSALPLLRALTESPEVVDEANFFLAHAILAAGGDPQETRDCLDKINPRGDRYLALSPVRTLADFAQCAKDSPIETTKKRREDDKKDREAHFTIAAHAFVSGDPQAAAEELLDLISKAPKWSEGRARLTLLAIFDHLEQCGRQPEMVRDLRRRLQIVS